MNFHSRNSMETVIAAGVAAVITFTGLVILASGFLPDSDEGLFDRGQRLEATFGRLGFAEAFAFSEVVQTASDALNTSLITRLPKPTAF